jgi:histidyl-tRNA synthetase
MMPPELSQDSQKIIAVLAADDVAIAKCLQVSQNLRQRNFQVEMPLNGNVGKKMKRANKIGAAYSIIIGSTEIEQKTVTIKNLSTGEQKTIAESELSTVQFN